MHGIVQLFCTVIKDLHVIGYIDLEGAAIKLEEMKSWPPLSIAESLTCPYLCMHILRLIPIRYRSSFYQNSLK